MAEQPRATILVVDDEKIVREVVDAVLGGAGHRVILATSGWEALSVCREHDGPIDMAVLDVVMPGMSGVELRKCLVELIPNVPILYMSGYSCDEIQNYGISATRDNFLEKPFTVGALRDKVARILTSRKPNRMAS